MSDRIVVQLRATDRDLRRLLRGDVSEALLVQALQTLQRIAPLEFKQLKAEGAP